MRRQLDKLLIACTAICVICTMAFVVIGAPTVLDTSNRTDDVATLARENAQRVREIGRLAKAIQASRRDSVLTTCRETNARHRKVIEALDVEIARASQAATPARVREMRQSRASTVRLLTAMLPVADCKARAKRLVTPTPAP